MVDIFRFVTVRAPHRIADQLQKRAAFSLEERDYNKNGFADQLSNVIKQATINGRPPQLPEKLLLQISSMADSFLSQNTFRMEEEFAGVKSKLENIYGTLLQMTEAANDSFSAAHVGNVYNGMFSVPPEKLLNETNFSLFSRFLWDMLFALFSTKTNKTGGLIDQVITGIRSVNLIKYFAAHHAFSADRENISAILIGVPLLPKKIFPLHLAPHINFDTLFPGAASESSHSNPAAPALHIKPLGIAELRVIRHGFAKYEPGEVTHIENVLKSEKRERKHRYLNRTEEFYLTEREKETEEERNLETTDRLELQREVSKTIQENFEVKAGVTVTYNGPVSVSANAGFSYSRAQVDAIREASNLAKEVINQTRKKIVERIREERSRKTIEEIEETNLHVFENNKETSTDISGIYRWVDKVYECRMFNYGKRLMFEMIIPEPAAFFKYMGNAYSSGITPPTPLPASFTLEKITSLTAAIEPGITIADLIREYKVEGIVPAPEPAITIGTSLMSEENDSDWGVHNLTTNDLNIKTGYEAESASLHFSFDQSNRGPATIAWSIGHSSDVEVQPGLSYTGSGERGVTRRAGPVAGDSHSNQNSVMQFSRTLSSMQKESGIVPITVKTIGVNGIVVGVEVTAKLTVEEFQKWQLTVYEKINQQYSMLLSEYENKKARDDVRKQTIQNPAGAENPAINKMVIEEELKKHCITMLTGWQFDGFDAMKYFEDSAPRINVVEAVKEGLHIRFFEEAFEWDKMTYLFYPYFWGRKSRWSDSFFQNSNDVLFKHFLRAGAARVVLPVIPQMTETLLWYVNTGELRIANAMPAIEGDTEYLSVVDEIYGQPDELDGGVEEGTPWNVTIPTSLVILQSQAEQLTSIV